MENRSVEHNRNIEVINLEHKNELAKIEQEQETTAKYAAMGDLFTNPEKISGLLDVLNNPDFQRFTK